MREIEVDLITTTVRDLCIEANMSIREDHVAALQSAIEAEESLIGRDVLRRLLENDKIARTERVALSQDTGYVVCFLDLGQDVRLVGGNLQEAVDQGVREGYRDAYLRASIVESPVRRNDTGDNTPALLYTEIVPGDSCKITILVKGAGSDNMSAIKMLTPAQGISAVVDFVVETVERAGPSASPPVTVGVGLGGTFEKSAMLAKRALTRTSGEPSKDPDLPAVEQQILEQINASGISPAGFGGTTTAVAVHVNSFPTHIAAYPVAVNLNCHSHRVRDAGL